MKAHLHSTLPFLIHRISATIADGANKEFQVLGLNVYASRVLILLLLDDAHTVGELADTASLDQSTLSHILRRMVRQKLLIKERQEHDNRSVLVTLTAEGKEVATKCWQIAQRHDLILKKNISAANLAVLKNLLNKVYENAPAFISDGTDSVASPQAKSPRKRPVK